MSTPGKFATILASLFLTVIFVPVLFFATLLFVLDLLISPSDPPKAKLGYTGEWRYWPHGGREERPLPPAAEVWENYSSWVPKWETAQRLYVVRMGGAERQSHFRASTNRGETPMGAQTYTYIDFTYTDPTNGTYQFTWRRRGKHDPIFLRFDDRYRTYQVAPGGIVSNSPPELNIYAIEGVEPEN